VFGFDFAFGLSSPINPSLGYLQLTFINYYYNSTINADGSHNRIKDKIPISFGLCGNSSNGFNYSNATAVQTYGIQNFYCPQN
jgi:hypothetical protein